MDLRISELPETSSLNIDDYLVFQKDTISYKIPISNFISVLQSNTHLKSSASCESTQFAPFAHGHDYTDFWFFPSYLTSSNIDSRQISCCGHFNVTKYLPGYENSISSSLCIWQPLDDNKSIYEKLSSYERYEIGDIQFVATYNFDNYLSKYRKYDIKNNNINIYNENFDGFVIPNGQTLTCQPNDFQAACKIYSANHDPFAKEFTLPNIYDMFFKCDPGLSFSQMTPLLSTQYHNALPAHNHTITASSNISKIKLNDIQISLRKTYRSYLAGTISTDVIPTPTAENKFNPNPYTYYNTRNYNNCFYAGSNIKRPYDMTNSQVSTQIQPTISDIEMNCLLKRGTCTLSGYDQESYPTYQCIQALLYIGLSSSR